MPATNPGKPGAKAEVRPGTPAAADAGDARRARGIAAAFFKLGCTSFGGPVAHLGYLREEFVTRRRWLDDEAFGDLVALCQFLPGPASSQIVFAIGRHRGGLAGALVASACFTLPSAVAMILFAYGVAAIGELRHAGWLHGLKLAAVAVVAQAVWGMGRRLCPDMPRVLLAVIAAAYLTGLPGAAGQVAVIVGGAIAGWLIYRRDSGPVERAPAGFARAHVWAAATLGVWAGLLVLLPVAATAFDLRSLRVFDGFYRAGSLVFGGGHVILPLLRAEVVPPGWIADDAFLAGYGAVQAVPGPLFTFSAYLGTVIHGGSNAWMGGLACLVAIFLPAWMLIGGALPFWHLLRTRVGMQGALRGANAAVVGVLMAALYNPVWQEGVTSARDVVAAAIAFALLEFGRVPPWLIVILAASAGQFLL